MTTAFSAYLWVVKKRASAGPLDPSAIGEWKEVDCPCGGRVRLGSHGGEHAIAHLEHSCSEFKGMAPLDFGRFMADFWFKRMPSEAKQ